MNAIPVSPPEEVLLGMARALRAAGVAVTADRERSYLTAVSTVGMDNPRAVFQAGRATLCGSPHDLARHDLVFAEWFSETLENASHWLLLPSRREPVWMLDDNEEGSPQSDQGVQPVAQASRRETLRHRDVASLTAREKAELTRILGRLQPRSPRRASHRLGASRHGELDPRRTLRDMLRRLGEPGRMRKRKRQPRPRRIVLLVDVSGSMSAYAEALLRLTHRYVSSGLQAEAFTVGTRLTHVTQALRRRDGDSAVVAAGDAIPDWSGGTRLADGLRFFLDRWGRRGMARGTVVVVFSDGWERSEPEELGEQMRRLRLVAHRVIWVNPHRGLPGYAPIQRGILAVIPHCDDFLAGHSLATFEELTELVARA